MVTAGSLALGGAAVGAARNGRAAAEGGSADALIERLHSGAALEQYLAQLVGALRVADRDGDGLDRADVELLRAQQAAQARAGTVHQVLALDLNSDFRVSAEEIGRSASGEAPQRAQQVRAMLRLYDSNGDSFITLVEAAAAAQEPRGDDQVEALLALDPNQDSTLTAAELRTLAERAFASVDSDGDGKISLAEYKPIEERVREARLIRSAPKCDLPPLPESVKLVVYGTYRSDALSSVFIGGPDQNTYLTEVTIEPGPTPLYVVLASYESMVWRLSGATDRVARVIVSSSRANAVPPRGGASAQRIARVVPPAANLSASGVVGVNRDRVTIAKSDCPPYFSGDESRGAKAALAQIRRALGRAPDAVFATYSASRVSLPSGTITKSARDSASLPAGFDAGTWREAAQFWPGGLAQVDPRDVVAAAAVAPYKVLPSQMGLSQLIGAGAITQIGPDTFRIVGPIAYLPAGMNGAHSVTMIVAKGVPAPPGDPGHSCVLREEDDNALTVEQRCALFGRPPPPGLVLDRGP
jgi:hypothetical protein